MRGVAVSLALVLYTIAMLSWLSFAISVARLEADASERFVRVTGWTAGIELLGLGWTVLLVATVVVAWRRGRRVRPGGMAAATIAAITVTVFVPAWFRTMGYIGMSTSEFMDALFLVLGGALPGGQATLGLMLTCVILGILTGAANSSSGPT